MEQGDTTDLVERTKCEPSDWAARVVSLGTIAKVATDWANERGCVHDVWPLSVRIHALGIQRPRLERETIISAVKPILPNNPHLLYEAIADAILKGADK